MEFNKALFLSQEITPYLPANTLSTLGRNVPQGLQERGIEVRTFMPKYGQINERRNQLHEVIRLSGLNIVIDDTDHPLIIKVATLLPSRMQVYFIDNDERIMFFARGVIETVKKLRWVPGIIQNSGWATALAPLYIRRMYASDPTLADTKLIYAILNDDVPQPLNPKMVDKLKQDGFTDEDLARITEADKIDAVALGKLAIDFSDAIVCAVPDAIPELVEYAKQTGKPMLDYPGGAENEDDKAYMDRYIEFYKSL